MQLERQPSTEKICKGILNDNTEPLEILDIVICSLFNSKGDNLKTVQLQTAVIWEHGPILKQTKTWYKYIWSTKEQCDKIQI